MIDRLEDIAADAARLIEDVRACGVSAIAKGDGSPVTEADTRAEALILVRLAAAFPDIPIVAEELSAATGAPDVVAPRFFLVDPLDGTKEFIKGTSDYTVNIALVENGVPVAGVVIAPARGDVFVGCDGRAWKGKLASTGGVIDRRQIAVRAPGATWTAVVSASHMSDATREFLAPLPIEKCVSVGSSLKFCLLASGEADLYPRLGRTMQWDTAAGDAVLRAAGGVTVAMTGAPLTYGPRPGLAVNRFENPYFIGFSGSLEDVRGFVAA